MGLSMSDTTYDELPWLTDWLPTWVAPHKPFPGSWQSGPAVR